MSKRCIIKGCEKEVSDGYSFPEKQADCTKWVDALKDHQTLPDDYKTQVICGDHFTPSDFLASRGKKKNLSKKAVPSIFPEVTDDDDTENDEENGFQNESIEIKEEDISNDEDEEMNEDSEGAIGSDDSDFEPDDGSEDMSGDEKRSGGSQFQQSVDESQDSERTTDKDSAFALQLNQKDDDADSDYEPVTETDIASLQAKINDKTSGLVREKCNLKCIEEKLRNRATTIKKLEAELLEYPAASGSQNGESSKPKVGDYNNPELRRFAISLYYFSPKVYAYMGSLLPYLPKKEVVLDWVKSGQANEIFPPGVLIKENFTQE